MTVVVGTAEDFNVCYLTDRVITGESAYQIAATERTISCTTLLLFHLKKELSKPIPLI